MLFLFHQIGFTTDPRVARSSPYCTDVAKVGHRLMCKAPMFKVATCIFVDTHKGINLCAVRLFKFVLVFALL